MRNGNGDEGAGTSGTSVQERNGRQRVARDLARLGVDESVCAELARRLEPLVRVLSPEIYGVTLAGVSLTHRVHREHAAALERSVRELSELQRLLGALAEELQKVDELVGVLTAQVKGFRAAARPAAGPPRRLVH
jgi:hypothetical protein